MKTSQISSSERNFQKVSRLVNPVSVKSCKVLQLKETYNLYSIKAASNSLEFTSEEKEENLQEGAIDQNGSLESPAQLISKENLVLKARKYTAGVNIAKSQTKLEEGN